MNKISAGLLFATALCLGGCSSVTDSIPGWMKPYRPDINQGNIVTQEMVDSLHEGMTRNQVIFLLGSPTLKSTFHENEWDYTYYFNPRIGETKIRHLSVKFDEDGRVESFKSDPMLDETDADLEILGERAREKTLQKAEQDKLNESSNTQDDTTSTGTTEDMTTSTENKE